MKKLIKSALAMLLVLAMAAPVMAAPNDGTEAETSAEPVEVTQPVENETPEAATNTSNVPLSAIFSDINTDDFAWARPYIDAMAKKGLISGYEDGTYRPDNDVTRQECLSLFARAMGSNDKANAEILEIAHDRYDSIIKNYSLTWGTDEIAYLMYKGALKRTDLDTYLKDEEKNTPMKRYEAAIIITKAMGGEEKALSDLGVVLTYTDAREVPSNAIQYVAYASEQGIMEGMGDGSFSPNTPVKRSQMAVMLSRTVDKTDYSFTKVKLNKLDADTRTVTVTDSAGEEKQYVYTDDTKLRNVGEDTQAKDMPTDVDAVITLSGSNLVSVETISNQPDQTVRGKYVSFASTSGRTTVRVTLDETGETQSFEVDPNVSVTYEGSPATVRSFSRGDVVIMELQNGKVVKMTGDTKITTVSNASVESLDITDGVKMTISHADSEYNGKTYDISSDVSVKKNNAAVGLDSIYKGDKVTLELQYGVITKITATSSTKTVDGTIKSLTISSPESTMTVYVNNEEKTYTIPKDVQITINGEEGSLYDFRVGDRVRITIDSEAITKIVATSTQESSGSISGLVTAINTSFGVISVKPDGSEISTQVFCKDDTTTFITADGKSKKMKDVKVGQTVEIKGTVSNGVFVGKLLIIVSE